MGTVVATPAADEAILHLRAVDGAVAFRPSNGPRRCDGVNLTETELPARINDIQLGEIGGVPFLIDADLYRGWGRPDLTVDVPQGIGGRPLADGAGGIRLMLRFPRCPLGVRTPLEMGL